MLGPEVSLSGSPTLLPTTQALCASLPLPPRWPRSMWFLALSQAPPALDIISASSTRPITAPIGSQDYGKEELVAEMAAAFLCSHCGIEPATIDQTAAYLQGWLKQLKQDKKLVVQSASAAQRAAEWVRGQRGR